MLHDVPTQTAWKIHVYRVSGALHQQRILSAFKRVDAPGVIALGTQTDADWFVVMECSSTSAELRAHQVLMTIDPHAARTYESRQHL